MGKSKQLYSISQGWRYGVTLDQWRARYEGLCVEAARLRTERNAARAEAAKLQSLIDLQQTRMDAANTLWQDAHPEKEHLCPDLGDLLAWLIEERAVLKTFRQLDRAAPADAQTRPPAPAPEARRAPAPPERAPSFSARTARLAGSLLRCSITTQPRAPRALRQSLRLLCLL